MSSRSLILTKIVLRLMVHKTLFCLKIYLLRLKFSKSMDFVVFSIYILTILGKFDVKSVYAIYI
jgi:hypothetical protein